MTRVLQISDTHIVPVGARAYGVVDTAAALADTVETIRSALPRIGPVDLVVVSGDLTDHGTAEEYARFAELIAPLGLPLRVVPGNHDRREPLRTAFDGLPATGPIDWVVDFDDLAVIGLDTLVEGSPWGALSGESLRTLGERLGARAGQPALVFCHHPPVESGIAAMDVQGLRDAGGLRRVLDAHDAPVTLACGHVHRMIVTRFGRVPLIIAPGTSHAVTLDLRMAAANSFTKEPGGMILHETAPDLRSTLLPVGSYPGPYPFSG